MATIQTPIPTKALISAKALAPTLYIVDRGAHHDLGGGFTPVLNIGTTHFPVHLKMTAAGLAGMTFNYQGIFQFPEGTFRKPEDLYHLEHDFQGWLEAVGFDYLNARVDLTVKVLKSTPDESPFGVKQRSELIDYPSLIKEFLDQLRIKYTYIEADPYMIPPTQFWSKQDCTLVERAYHETAMQMDMVLASYHL